MASEQVLYRISQHLGQGLQSPPRLSLRQRNVAAHAQQPDVAQALWQGAVAGGAQAAARPVAGLAVGQQADFIVLDAHHLALAGLSPEQMLASHVFASSRQSAVAQVWSGGQLVVQEGRHALHDEAMAGLVQARRDLLQT